MTWIPPLNTGLRIKTHKIFIVKMHLRTHMQTEGQQTQMKI